MTASSRRVFPATVTPLRAACQRALAAMSPRADNVVAGIASALALLLLLAALLSQHPRVHGDAADVVMRLRFIARASVAADPSAPTPGFPRAADAATAGTRLTHPRAQPPPTAARAAGDRLVLYGRDGRLLLPDGIGTPGASSGVPPGLADTEAIARAKRRFERINPIDYRETRFEKDWATDGTAGDALLENAHGTLEGMAVIPLGTGDQPARARPPPEVRFNPAHHERMADLGSEATGDAYKAAPIAAEKAPGLDGAASRRIREQMTALGRDFAHCRAQAFAQLARPVRLHLSQLEAVEHAFAYGTDPVRAAHLLPREADMAYDLARRALWHARMKLGACTP